MPQLLPEDLERSTIASMGAGEEAFTMHWAMWVDENRRCWLHPDYPAFSAPAGTAQLRIARMSDGYHVFIAEDTDVKWDVQREPGYAGDSGNFIPVAELHRPA